MAITRTVDTDDDGTGTTGTIHNNAWLQAIYAAIENWESDSYTPAMQGSGSNPTLSAAVGTYLQIGDLVVFRAKCTISTVGSGSYFVTLPVTADGTIGANISVFVQDASPAATYVAGGYLDTTARAGLFMVNGTTYASVAMTHVNPITFASGDIITVFGTYFAA